MTLPKYPPLAPAEMRRSAPWRGHCVAGKPCRSTLPKCRDCEVRLYGGAAVGLMLLLRSMLPPSRAALIRERAKAGAGMPRSE